VAQDGSIIKRKLKDGSLRYDVVVDLGPDPVTGKRRQRKQTFKTKREAVAFKTARLAEIAQGTAVDRSRQTVAELLRYWLTTYAQHHVRPGTLEGYGYTINGHIIPALGAVPVQRLTAQQVQQFYSDKLTAGCSPRTVQLCHLRLKQALDMAVTMGLVVRNVADATKPPSVERREMRTWTAAQARQFLAVAAQSSYGPIWLLLLATGMRRGEALGLRWQDVDALQGVVHVRQTVTVVRGAPHVGPPQSRSSRRAVPVPAHVMAALREHHARQNAQRLSRGTLWQNNDLVFASAVGTPINPNNLTRDYDRWVKQAGVPRIRIHDQRHTHVTLALAAGANFKAVSQRVGHAKPSITLDLYAYVLPEQHRDVSDRVGAALFGPVSSGAL
jgi:integrase